MQLARRLLVASCTVLAACSSAPVDTLMQCRPPACVPAQNSYAAEVAGVQSSSIPSVEFADLILDEMSGYFVLTLPEFATVSGKVQADGKPVAASMVFTRPSRIPGRPAVFYQANLDDTGVYTVSLPPNLNGEDYTVRVQPVDTAQLPPAAFTLHVDGNRTLDITMATGDKLAQLHGKVKDAVGAGVADARVVVRDAVTQLDVSTVGHTDADGAFVLAVPFDAAALASALVLSIERDDPMNGRVAASIELTPSQLQAQLIDASFLYQLPALPAPTRVGFRIVGTASNGLDKPVAGAHVLLRSALEDVGLLSTIRAHHEIEAQTDADGKISVGLYSNDAGARAYSISISPPADSEFQATTSTVTAGTASGVSATIRLSPRPVLTGQVLTPDGKPLLGAVLQPSTTDDSQARSLATASKTSVTTTDEDGRFVMRLDVGTYELGLIPPSSAMLPRRWLPPQTITGDVNMGALSAPMPIKFDGVVLGPDGQPLKKDAQPLQSSVRVYLVPAGNAGCDKDVPGCLVPPRLQAEGTTNKDGRAALLFAADGT